MRRLLTLLALIALGANAAPPTARATSHYIYLSVQLSGTGSGAWQSADGYIDCRSVNGYVDPRDSCDAQYEPGPNGRVLVPYTVTPAAGSCIQDGFTCDPGVYNAVLDFGADASDSVQFNLQKFAVTVTRSGAGTGKVISTPTGIDCGSTCSKTFNYGTEVFLTALPDAGAYFAGWTGACAGEPQTCKITVTQTTSTNAVFGFGTPPPNATSPPPTPVATPKATQSKAPTTKAPATAPPGSLPLAEATPETTTGPGESGPAEATAAASSSSVPSPLATPPAAPAAGTGDGSIALAIFGAGAVIALTIAALGVAVLRRRPPTA